jgi:hypothetical protein
VCRDIIMSTVASIHWFLSMSMFLSVLMSRICRYWVVGRSPNLGPPSIHGPVRAAWTIRFRS